jgi:hypothetical protein
VARSDHDLIWGATLSLTSGTAAAGFPLTNAQGSAPVPVFQSVGTSVTIQIAGTGTPVALALINCRADSGSFEGHAITFPGLDDEDQRINPWLDLRALSIGASPWDLVLTVAAGTVFLGRIVLVTALQDLNVKHGTWRHGRTRPGEIRIPTKGGHIIKHTQALRSRWCEGTVDLSEDEAMLSTLDLAAHGDYYPYLVIPDENVNSALWAHQTVPYENGLVDYDVPTHKLRFEELVMGPVNG